MHLNNQVKHTKTNIMETKSEVFKNCGRLYDKLTEEQKSRLESKGEPYQAILESALEGLKTNRTWLKLTFEQTLDIWSLLGDGVFGVNEFSELFENK